MNMTQKNGFQSEQLNEALKKGESREAHRLSRIIAGGGVGTRRRHTCPGYLQRDRAPNKERKSWSNPLTKADAVACESFSAMKSKQ